MSEVVDTVDLGGGLLVALVDLRVGCGASSFIGVEGAVVVFFTVLSLRLLAGFGPGAVGDGAFCDAALADDGGLGVAGDPLTVEGT